jgi:hypothetical protein
VTERNRLRADIEIDAAPDAVWEVLMDFGAFPRWNPFIVSIEGTPAVGSRLRVRLLPDRGRAVTIRPTVTVHDPGRAFGWLGRMGLPHVFDGAHRFTLEPLEGGGRTRFVQSEAFSGALLPIVRRLILPGTLRAFESMNEALAARVETRADRND